MYQIGKYQIKIDTSQNQSIGYVINTQTGEVTEAPLAQVHVDVVAAKAAAVSTEPTTEESLRAEIATLQAKLRFLEQEAYLPPAKYKTYNEGVV